MLFIHECHVKFHSKPHQSFYHRLYSDSLLYFEGFCTIPLGFNSFAANVANWRRHSRLATSPIGDLDPSPNLPFTDIM